MARGETPDPEGHALVCMRVFVGTLKNKRDFAKLCRTLFPNTGCFSLCLLLQTEGAQKRSRSTGTDRSTFRPRTDLKQPDKVLAPFFPSPIHGPPILICLTGLFLFLSLSPTRTLITRLWTYKCFNVNGWSGGSATYASCGAPTEKQVQFQVMS